MTQLSNFKCESTPNKQHMNHGGKEKFPLTRILTPSHSDLTFKLKSSWSVMIYLNIYMYIEERLWRTFKFCRLYSFVHVVSRKPRWPPHDPLLYWRSYYEALFYIFQLFSDIIKKNEFFCINNSNSPYKKAIDIKK